jgi:GNAT superfamily N-acetyltransferase
MAHLHTIYPAMCPSTLGDQHVTVTIERALPEDAEALVGVQVAAFHSDATNYPGVQEGGPPGYDSVGRALAKMARDDYFTIRCDGAIAGGIVVQDHGGAHRHLDLIYLDPSLHGQGIGSQAMRFIEAHYDATRWTLDTPSYALRNQHFYAKFGFVKIGEEERHGLTLFLYEKRA